MTYQPPRSAVVPWERLALLFDDVSAQPLHSRDVYLTKVCAGDAALHAELSALIAAADRAPDFLRGLADDVLSSAVFAAAAEVDLREREVPIPTFDADDASVPILAGTRIRHFEVLEPLGAGGMGVVHRGRDHRLNRDVALKFLSSAYCADPSARQRLVREAQAASSLDDPHVCPMYAIEDAPNGGLCLVMGYCSDGTLRDRLRAGALPIREANEIVEQIARGLACAHRAQLVHRDIKPANIGFADHGIAKILDFGVAVRGGEGSELDTTEESPLAGTLPYMSPERLQGEAPDASADIWALGVVYYEMLTGRRPFVASTHAALLHDILEREPAPIARVDGAVIPAAMVTLVLDMLQKSPARRPRNGEALVQRLTSIKVIDPAGTRPADPRGPTPAATEQKSGPRRRWVPLAGVVVALAASAFFLRTPSDPVNTAPLQVVRSSAPLPSIAVLPFAVRGSTEIAYLREGMVDVLTPALDATGLLRGVDPNTILGAASKLPSTPMDSSAARELALRVGAQRYVTGSVVQTGASLTMRATLHYADGKDVARAQVTVSDADGLLLGAEALIRQLVATELRAPGDTMVGVAAAMTTSKRALRAYIDGERELRDARPAAAMAFFSQAVADDSLFALAWYRLARAARWSDVDSVNARATARAFALSPTLPVRLQQLLGAYHALRLGSPVDAERQLRQIVADYPNDVDAWMLVGEARFDLLQYMGRPATEATDAFRRVMALDPQNREVTVYLMELAARDGRLGELDTLFQMYFRPNSAGEQPGVRATYLALYDRRVRGVRRSIDDAAGAQLALRRAGSEPSDLKAAASFASTLAANKTDSAMQLEGLLALATLDVAAAQFIAARQRWRDAALLDADATLLHRALMYAAPSLPIDVDTLEALGDALVRSTSAVSQDAKGLTAPEHRALRVYLGGLLSARLQDTTRLMRAQRQLAKMAPVNRLSVPLAYALQGHAARLRRDEAAAIVAFERSMVDIPASVRVNIPALGQQLDRFAHAEALRALGRTDEARRWYRSLREGPGLMNAPYLALTPTALR